jgi:hypothetical protein
MQVAPRRIPLTVKGARIAHNRHGPEAKKDICADGIVLHHNALVDPSFSGKSQMIMVGAEGQERRACPAFVGATAYP